MIASGAVASPPREQLDWLDSQAYADPRWADTEMSIRRMAVEIQNRLHAGDSEVEVATTMLVPSGTALPAMGPRALRFRMVRAGGLEELLLIEECLRKAMREESWEE